MPAGFLLPDVDDENTGPFWAAAAEHRLVAQRCRGCGRRNMPPRPMCPACRGLDFDWEALGGYATIWSFVVVHPPVLPAYAEFAPYPVITVSVDEDPNVRFVGNLVSGADAPINSVDPSTIEIGQRVRVVFAEVGEVTFPRWTPA